jgi:hypothetical protein
VIDAQAMQIIGICRFSYPALGGFQVEHATQEERMAYLYAPDRMEDRFRLFESFTLPSLKAQTDPNFTLLVVIGDTLPEPWRTRLYDLLSALPQAIVQPHAPGQHRQVMKEAVNSVRKQTGLPCLQFRMDDDDAVAVDFISKLRAAATGAQGLIEQYRHVGFDFIQGYIAQPGADGLSVRAFTQPLITAALAISVKPNIPNSIMNFSHKKIYRRMPVVSLPGEDMFLRGHSEFNDSRQVRAVPSMELEPAGPDLEAHIEQRFGLSLAQIRARFAEV